MPLPKRPVHSLDDINQKRRDRETINQVLDHTFDDSRVQTPAEKLAGVTPINKAYPPGDLRRYGGFVGGDATTNTVALQNALDSNQLVRIREQGIILLNDTIIFNGGGNTLEPGNRLRGEGRGTVLQWDVDNRSLIRARGVDTEGRKFNMGISDITLDGTDRTNPAVTGIDLKNWNNSNFTNFAIRNCENLLYAYGVTDPPDGALYVRFFDCDFQSAVTAIQLGTLANGFIFSSCRVADAVDGVVGDDNTENAFHNIEIEGITGDSVRLGASATCQYYYFSMPRIEIVNNGFNLHAMRAQSTTIVGPQLTAVSGEAFVTGAYGADTVVISGERNSPKLRANVFYFGAGGIDNTQHAQMYATSAAAVALRNSADSGFADFDTRDLSFRRSLFMSGTTAFVSAGAGSPEGVLTAPVGSIYSRTDGGAGTSIYVKETGVGNTGWVGK